jgi:hypothetical protein
MPWQIVERKIGRAGVLALRILRFRDPTSRQAVPAHHPYILVDIVGEIL